MTNLPTNSPADHMLKFRIAGARTTNRQITYLHILIGISIQQIARQARISEKTTMRILLGQRPSIPQLRKLQSLARRYSTQFRIAKDYCDRSPEGEHLRTVFHHLYTYGQILAKDTKNL